MPWGDAPNLCVPYGFVRSGSARKPSYNGRVRRPAIVLIPILVTAASLRFWALDFGLPHVLAHPDEARVAKTAVDFLGGRLHPGFFNYPTLFMYALGAAYLGLCGVRTLSGEFGSIAACAASWPHAWEPFFLTARVLSALAGTVSVFLVYRIGRRVSDLPTGLAAGAFLAVAFLHVRDSHFGVTDVPMTMMLLAAVAAVLRAHDAPSAWRFAGAGVLAGLAASTKYNAALLAVAILVSQTVRWIDDRRLDSRVPVFGAAMAAAFVAGSPFVVLDWPVFWRDVTSEAEHLRLGHAIRLAPGWRHHALVTLPLGLTLPLFAASLAGLAWMAWRMPRRAALLLAFPVVYYAVAGRGYTVFARYMVPIVPFLCVTAGFFAASAARAVTRRMPRASLGAVLLAVVAAIGAAAMVKSVRLDRLLARTDSRVLTAEWIESHVAEGSTVHLSGSSYGRPDLSRRGRPAPYELWGFDEASGRFISRRGATTDRPRWVVVQESPLVRYSSVPDRLREALAGYALRQSFRALDMSIPRVYDQQDAWYVPLGGFQGVGRPGPNLYVYEARN